MGLGMGISAMYCLGRGGWFAVSSSQQSHNYEERGLNGVRHGN